MERECCFEWSGERSQKRGESLSPQAAHSHSVLHILKNVKSKYHCAFDALIFAAAKASNIADFNEAIEKMKISTVQRANTLKTACPRSGPDRCF